MFLHNIDVEALKAVKNNVFGPQKKNVVKNQNFWVTTKVVKTKTFFYLN